MKKLLLCVLLSLVVLTSCREQITNDVVNHLETNIVNKTNKNEYKDSNEKSESIEENDFLIENNLSGNLSYYQNYFRDCNEETAICYEFIFPNGYTIVQKQKNPKTFLMVNGTFAPEFDIVLDDEEILFPLNIISKFFNVDVLVDIDNENAVIKYNNTSITLNASDTKILYNNQEYKLLNFPTLNLMLS